jgi:hypothetical protein
VRRKSIVALFILLIAISLFILLFLIQDIVSAIISLVTFLIGLTLWIYDRLEEYWKKKVKIQTIGRLFSVCEEVLETRFPSFVDGATIGRDVGVFTILERMEKDSFIDSFWLEEVVDLTIRTRCHDTIVDELGREVFHHLVLHVISKRLNRRQRRHAKSLVGSFFGEKTVFMDTGPVLSPEGDLFAKAVVYLRTRGGIYNLKDFQSFLKRDLDAVERNKVSLELSDPQLSFMVYGLGKGSDLLDLVRRKMSGRRLMKGLSDRTGMKKKPKKSFKAFLILKQEMISGDRYLRKRLDEIPNRIVGPGSLYEGAEVTGHQSINVLRLPSRYPKARNFVQRYFSEISKLNTEELRRASLVAIPLHVDDAYFYPEDPSTLRPAQQDFYRKWIAFFKKDRKVLRELLADFDITFLDLVDMLSLDFLVKDISDREKEYLQERSGAILMKLGLRNLLEISNVSVTQLKDAMRSQGLPNYETRDIVTLIDSYVIPLRQFLDNRLAEISRFAIRNSKKIRALRQA